MDTIRKGMKFIYDPAWQETDHSFRDIEIARREMKRIHTELIEAGFKMRKNTHRPDICRHYHRDDWSSVQIILEGEFTFDELAMEEFDMGERKQVQP